jgi:DNA polymerase
VFGAGDPDADLMVVGEAPGADEDRQGVPFVGRAGQLLTRMLIAIDLPREEVFICNTLKCRPPGNRTPELTEIAACLPYLRLQIELVRPRIILALGSPAARTLLDTREGITRLRGRIFPRFGCRVVPSFHPAYLLRNPRAKRESWADLKLVRRLLDEGS